ncbi:MAG TPA: HAMP domain-containing sensor histidine kinase [Gemmataceae bacterium]|jgi:signal transduction histidine kinase|nr:HAMP domain-containing sensor histidine kinase [Gemmataceae bacterium]
MRSIRLSMIVYFLVLLAAAMGLVSWLVYRTADDALRERQATNRELLESKFKDRRQEVRQKLDSELLHSAYTLASLAQSQVQTNRGIELQTLQLGFLTSAPSPYGHLTVPIWLAEGGRTRAGFYLHLVVDTKIKINEELLDHDNDKAAEFLQINTLLGKSWQSQALGNRPLPFNEIQFANMKLYDWEMDDVSWDSKNLRRVKLNAPIAKQLFRAPPSPALPFNASKGGSTGRPRPWNPPAGPAPPRPAEWENNSPPMLIQCAADTSQRDQALAVLEAELAEQKRELEEDSQQTRRAILMRLFWINLGTFAALYTGGLLLIAFGLAPLRRLSDAVSRVSEKDFELRYKGPEPPRELVPIVDRLKHTLAMLRRAFDREKQATADISHELRTPLAGLLATLEVALRKPRSTEDYRKTLEECREIVRQMTRMAERLLALNSLDARSDAVRPEPFDAAELTEQCATLMRPLANASDLQLTVHNGQPVPVTTDPDKLREIVANLMHNAIEYNRPNGSVHVTIKPWENGLELEVADTGVGIPPESRDKIFERFYRADPSRQASSLHAGLGLAIVRGYVDLMGGTISVESELGRGSTFRVRLPSLAGNGSNGRE